MRYAFFTNTPAHVHLYKHAVRELEAEGHDVLVLGRDYGCTEALLDAYDLPYVVYGSCETSKLSLFSRLPGHYATIARRVREFDPDLLFGMGGYAAHAGIVSRTPVVLILDSEPTSLDHAVSRPFARAILTPHAFEKDLGSNHYRFRGFKETAYLHPDVFEADPSIRDRLGVEPDEPYAIVRFNAFGSHHDVGQGGFTADQRRALLDRLSDHATVFVSDEGDDLAVESLGGDVRAFDLHPARLHDALAEARLLVADTQTMVTEAAMLATPAVRSNSFVGDDDMGNFLELESQGLVRNVGAFDEVVETATDLLADADAPTRWARRRDDYVADVVNLTDVITAVATAEGAVDRVDAVARRVPAPHAD